MKRASGTAAGLFLFLGFATSAETTIITGAVTGGSASDLGGVFQELFPPIGEVGQNNFDRYHLFALNELQNVLLTDALLVDVGSTIPAGTAVSSHYVFFDPPSQSQISGYVDFGSTILGVITSRQNLLASDFLGDPTTIYVNNNHRGFEQHDQIFDDPDPLRLSLQVRAGTPGDYIRVLTTPSDPPSPSPVPEPTTLSLLAAGLLSVAAFRRLRRS